MMRSRITVILILFSIMGLTVLWSDQGNIPDRDKTIEEYSHRYDVENWPGKDGDVIAGLELESLFTDINTPVIDHDRWIEVNDESVVMRQYTMSDYNLIIEAAVTRTCQTAHQLLFSHLTRQNSMKPLGPPALPFGRIRLVDIGEVCFGLPQHGKDLFHSIEFVRNNVVILLRTKGGSSLDLKHVAMAIDALILSRTAYTDWQSSGLWISIDRLEAGDGQIRSGSAVPLFISINNPGNEPITRTWELSSGGILKEDGRINYYTEGAGWQTITLRVANRSGLAASARATIYVTE